MAFIGMRHVVAAPVSAHTPGAEPTYGTGFDVGMAITGNLTINRNNNPLYADDVIAEDDNGITGMELELGVDDLTDEIEANMARLKYQPMTVITRVIAATNQLGLFTRDEYREMLGYPPLGPDRGGDEIMIAVNNMEADDQTKQEDKYEDKKEDEEGKS